MRYIGFCGAAKSGKTTLRDAVLLEMTKQCYETKGTHYNGDTASFAEPLKWFCVNLLGLSYPQVYGDDKNTYTKYTWEQIPNNPLPDLNYYSLPERIECLSKRDSTMTAREVMQWWGTDVFRAMDEDFWVNKLKYDRNMGYDGDCYIDDVRFPNEASMCDTLIQVMDNEGETPSLHESEQQYKLLNPHLIINTRHIGLEQAAKQVCEFLHERFAK